VCQIMCNAAWNHAAKRRTRAAFVVVAWIRHERRDHIAVTAAEGDDLVAAFFAAVVVPCCS